MSICDQRNLHTDLSSKQTQNHLNESPTPYLETTMSHPGTQAGCVLQPRHYETISVVLQASQAKSATEPEASEEMLTVT